MEIFYKPIYFKSKSKYDFLKRNGLKSENFYQDLARSLKCLQMLGRGKLKSIANFKAVL